MTASSPALLHGVPCCSHYGASVSPVSLELQFPGVTRRRPIRHTPHAARSAAVHVVDDVVMVVHKEATTRHSLTTGRPTLSLTRYPRGGSGGLTRTASDGSS